MTFSRNCPAACSAKGQSTIEFMVLIGLGLLFALFAVSVIGDHIQRIFSENEYVVTRDMAFRLQKELLIAAEVDTGYFRSFELPQELDGIGYSVSISNKSLVLSSQNYEQVVFVPYSVGQFLPGQLNTINKSNGTIMIN